MLDNSISLLYVVTILTKIRQGIEIVNTIFVRPETTSLEITFVLAAIKPIPIIINMLSIE